MRVADIPPKHRGQGTTTRQMLDAPNGALFIWPNVDLSYPKALSRDLGRSDLIVMGPAALQDGGYRLAGMRLSAVIADHACALDEQDLDALRNIEARWVRSSASQ